MRIALKVINPFNGHRRGDHIGDPQAVQKILQSPHAGDVIRVSSPEPSAPAPMPRPVLPSTE